MLVIRPPAHHPLRQLGITGDCEHEPGITYGSPNGAFPMANGDTAITEINGDWLDVLTPRAAGRWSRRTRRASPIRRTPTRSAPGCSCRSTTPTPARSRRSPPTGQLRWRYEPSGADALNQPSLALPLPNGDILANDDKNDRVIVVDPHTNKIVWQYGHTHVPGSGEGFLSNPDGVDLAPPYSLTQRFAATHARALSVRPCLARRLRASARARRRDVPARAPAAGQPHRSPTTIADASDSAAAVRRRAASVRSRVDREDRRALRARCGAAAAEHIDVGAERNRGSVGDRGGQLTDAAYSAASSGSKLKIALVAASSREPPAITSRPPLAATAA